MKIVVTGGSGFIGTHLCRALKREGHDVRVLDLRDAREPVDGVHYVRGDVRDGATVRRELEGADAVYHFAAIVNVAECQDKPHESYRTNFMGTVEVLQAVREEGERTGRMPRVIFAGSSAVYGRNGLEGEPISEEGVAGEPLSFYASQKLASEHAIRMFHEYCGVPAVTFRFFNVYGYGQDPKSPYSGVITIFSRLAHEGRDLPLNDGGFQTRDFVSVHDLVRANLKALELPADQCDGRAINLGTGRTVTIRQLGATILEAAGGEGDLITAPARPGDVPHSRADISRARDLLGWEPEVSLEAGIRDLIN